jgi:hypothetical protein
MLQQRSVATPILQALKAVLKVVAARIFDRQLLSGFFS